LIRDDRQKERAKQRIKHTKGFIEDETAVLGGMDDVTKRDPLLAQM